MQALIADAFSEEHLGALHALGLDVDYAPTVSAAELLQKAAQTQILIVRSKAVQRPVIESAKMLGLIVRAGAGVNTIDIDAASERGVFVANCPGQNAIAVAELTMGHLLCLDRRIPDQVMALHAGRWNKKEYSKAKGLFGRTLGVIGLGAIGLAVVARARAFGMNVAVWSRSLTAERARALGVTRADSIESLCEQADAVTVHLAYTPQTKHAIGAAAFGRMKPGALFINASRAEIVDTEALQKALSEKHLRVGLDVFDHEPEKGEASFSDPLLAHKTVYGTHHVGASTEQAQAAIADETVRIVAAYVQSGDVPNCVNVLPAARTPAAAELIVRHFDCVGVLAEVLGSVRRHHINVEAMHNTIFAGAKAACARIRLATRPSAELLAEIRSRPEMIHVDVIDLPPMP